ncbi:hypothetical protein [Faecalibacterium sp. An122]|uniref:hypothetical protein n=1 Tax=Faecalibacterium sp. An122 TaxID=1965551 RepID=UPI000B36B76C|nr:hypothetical protein [Faecalibacterium sp. An122]OUQ34932.1 hypothetical protein B5E67_12575 [Faecalibacterium sp. An122]
MDLGNHVVGIKEAIGIVLVFAAFLLLVRWRARRRSETIAWDFLGRYPNAALLYVYLEDAPGNDGKIVSRKGTVSPIFDAGNAPDFGIKKGFACYVAPGPVELDVKASWVEDLYVGKRPRSIRTQVSFHAEPGLCGGDEWGRSEIEVCEASCGLSRPVCTGGISWNPRKLKT